MLNVMKWSLPVVAFGVMVALAGVRAEAQADDKAGAKGKITGTVQLEDGSPAANATIRVMAAGAKPDKPAAEKEPKPQAADEAKPAQDKPADGEKPAKPKQEPVATGKTDAQGKFEIEVPAGTYTVFAQVKGQGRAQKKVDVKAGQTVDTGTLTVKKQPPKKEAAPST